MKFVEAVVQFSSASDPCDRPPAFFMAGCRYGKGASGDFAMTGKAVWYSIWWKSHPVGLICYCSICRESVSMRY